MAATPCSGPYPTYGITSFDTDGEGALFAPVYFEFTEDRFKSEDGGLTWQNMEYFPSRTGRAPARGDKEVATPRGYYRIEGADVLRTLEGEEETVYSESYLKESRNETLHRLVLREIPENGPFSIHYDGASQNIIIAAGVQGVVVETRDGSVTRVGVGPYQPISFSTASRMRFLSFHWFWIFAVLLAVGSTAFVLIVAAAKSGVAVAIGIMIGGIVAAMAVLPLASNLYWIVITLLVLVLGMFPAFYAVGTLPAQNEWRIGTVLAFIILVVTGSIAASPGRFILTDAFEYGRLFEEWFFVLVTLILVLLTRAALPYRPSWRITTAAFGAMTLGIVLPTTSWLVGGVSLEASKALSVMLVAVAALVLFVYLKRRQPQSPEDFYSTIRRAR